MCTKQRLPLGARERFFWLLDQQRPVHFSKAVEVAGHYLSDQWYQALGIVQQQHALLSAAIQINSNKVPEFTIQASKPIAFKVVKVFDPDSWGKELEQDAAQRFNSISPPLLIAEVYESDNSSVNSLSVHHAISDGRSLIFLLGDLLNAMNGRLV